MAVGSAENEFKFRNEFAQTKSAFVIQSEPTRGCKLLQEKGEKLLRLQMAANKFIISHALRSQTDAIIDGVNSIESNWDKLLPRGVQLQLQSTARAPVKKRGNDNEAGNKYPKPSPKRFKMMEPTESRDGSWFWMKPTELRGGSWFWRNKR